MTADRHHPDQLAVQHDRNAQQRPEADYRLRAERIFGVSQDIRDLHRLTGKRHPAHHTRPVTRVWMRLAELVGLGTTRCLALPVDVSRDAKELTIGQVELTMLAATETNRSLKDLVQDRLQTRGTGNSAQNVADR